MNPLVDRLSSRTAAFKYDLPSIPIAWMLALSVLPGRRSETVHSNETRG